MSAKITMFRPAEMSNMLVEIETKETGEIDFESKYIFNFLFTN